MSQATEWQVELAISGPIAVKKRRLNLNVQKGDYSSFWTTVNLVNERSGIRAEIIARASSRDNANDAAVYFVGQMLDVLCLRLDLPLHLSLSGPQFRPLNTHVKRIVDEQEWKEAFKLGREYGLNRLTFSRALSWYRKGLVSENPIDKFIAFWVSLEIIGSKHARRDKRTRKGAINQICDCFDQIWGSVETWRVIPNENEWVNRFHKLRNDIAHGVRRVDIETIQEAVRWLAKLRQLAHAFLSDWEQKEHQSAYLVNLGRADLNKSCYRAAQEKFMRALQVDPENDFYLYYWSLAYRAINPVDMMEDKLHLAIQHARKGYENNPRDWRNTLNLALYRLTAEETEEAARLYREILSGGVSSHQIRSAICNLDDLLILFPDHPDARAIRDLLQQHLQEAEG